MVLRHSSHLHSLKLLNSLDPHCPQQDPYMFSLSIAGVLMVCFFRVNVGRGQSSLWELIQFVR